MLIIVIIMLVCVMSKLYTKPPKRHSKQSMASNANVCTQDTCGAIDPVNDPDYNMKNIIKQSILLEEHVAEKSKYCISCIVKHFMHIIALLEEAVWLAGPNVAQFPFLENGVEYYQNLFDTWLANRHNDEMKKQTLSMLRERRRQLIDAYILAKPPTII